MGFLLSFFAAFQTILGFLAPVANSIEEVLKRLGIYKHHAQGVSLADMARNTRVQPITVISKDLLGVSELENVLLNVLNVFTAYYIQAFSVNSIRINGVSVDKILYKYNPNGVSNSFESFNTSPTKKNYEYSLPGTSALEADNTPTNIALMPNGYMKDTGDNDLFKYDANLSVGKLITLNLTIPMHSRLDKASKDTTTSLGGKSTSMDKNEDRDSNSNTTFIGGKSDGSSQDVTGSQHSTSSSVGGELSSNVSTKEYESNVVNDQWDRDITIPVLVQLSSVVLSNDSVTNLIATNSVDKSLSERWVQYKSGQIRFVQDLILCNDIIDEKKKLLMNDETDTYLNILKRISKAQVNALISENGVSFASASNIYVISEEVAKEIEYRIGGKLSSPRMRDKLFVGNYGMILVVVDRQWERATFYYRNMDGGTDVSFKALAKSATGKSSGDIYEIFKTFNNGGSPIF